MNWRSIVAAGLACMLSLAAMSSQADAASTSGGGDEAGDPISAPIYVNYECDPQNGFNTTVTVIYQGNTYTGVLEGVCINAEYNNN